MQQTCNTHETHAPRHRWAVPAPAGPRTCHKPVNVDAVDIFVVVFVDVVIVVFVAFVVVVDVVVVVYVCTCLTVSNCISVRV